MGRKVNWGMLLSHHPPCQYDRTVRIGKVRLCVRCLAIFSGVGAAFVWDVFLYCPFIWMFICLLLLPLPAIFNFTLKELKLIRNRNHWRFITGLLLGYGLGCSIGLFWTEEWIYGLILIAWMGGLEFIVVLVLVKAGVIDAYIKEYEDGLYRC